MVDRQFQAAQTTLLREIREAKFSSAVLSTTRAATDAAVTVVGEALLKAATHPQTRVLLTKIMSSAMPAYEKIKLMIETAGKTIQKLVSTPDSWIVPISTLGVEGWKWFADLAEKAVSMHTTLGDNAPKAKADEASQAALARTTAVLQQLNELRDQAIAQATQRHTPQELDEDSDSFHGVVNEVAIEEETALINSAYEQIQVALTNRQPEVLWLWCCWGIRRAIAGLRFIVRATPAIGRFMRPVDH